MKKMLLFYNPYAGEKGFHLFLDDVIRLFQEGGYTTQVVRSNQANDIPTFMEKMSAEYDAITVAGGDGTVNQVVNGLLKRDLKIPIGIFPAGTANDFGTYLGMSKNVEETAKMITKGHLISSDVGKANDQYFINVCGAGLLTNVSQNIDIRFKAMFGKLAYYIKGAEQIPKFEPISIRIEMPDEIIEEDIFFFVVLNSAGAGGFEKLIPDASISDGHFDFLAIRAIPIASLAVLFLRLINGDYLDNPNVIYRKCKEIKIESRKPLGELAETDIDGEVGPDLPVEISVIPNRLPFFASQEVMEHMLSLERDK